ncbi:MAG TPA: glycoside hydrolase family 130 protein, partial [Acidimicrobiia bacterium]|nr:glycoside hydrolase family 130 protein [Acidimicrobiia bacterium]
HASARFTPDPTRVIAKPFLPGEQIFPDGQSRTHRVVKRVLAMSDAEVTTTLASFFEDFGDRHLGLEGALERHFAVVSHYVDDPDSLGPDRRLLIGAYFTHEYSIEASALGNPSMVPAPDQTGLQPGERRFIISLRAIGEGHLSSIEFRSGVIDAGSEITIDEPSGFATTGSRRSAVYEKRLFRAKLAEMGVLNEIAAMVLDLLPERFSIDEINSAIAEVSQAVDRPIAFETAKTIHWLASSNYELTFDQGSTVSERVIFPAGPTESRGMEDARFVQFIGDDGSIIYYATYTAFDGFQILPQLIETSDLVSFEIATLQGSGARNKGVALFPRLIDGRYAALSRQDNENNYLMLADDVRLWDEAEKIQVPTRPWELMQLGNCGSPMETEAGWLVITHGVGPMRRYSLGAILLDAADPRRVIGHLHDPLLVPSEDERDGYVPNVVYSCGGMIHGENLILPYGYSDYGARIAKVRLDDLLTELTSR